MARLNVLVVVCVISWCAPFAPDANAATVGEMVAAIEQAAASAGLDTREPAAARALTIAITTLRDAGVFDEEIGTFVERYTSPDAVALARRRQERYTVAIKEAVDTIKAVTNGILIPLGGVMPSLRASIVELQTAEQNTGLTWDLETLRRLERKYGPESAKLNGLEVLAAYGLQRVRVFGVDEAGRPGPLEVVLAYAPAYISRSDEQMRLVGVAEIGLRNYFFRAGWGTDAGRLAFLRPGYSSFGLAWAGGSDDPLRPPWQGSSRVGAFFGWGEIKVAWLAGTNQRVLVTQQFQLIPWVF